MKTSTKKVESFLPVFSGFYENHYFEPNEENEIDYINEQRSDLNLCPLNYDDFIFDYENYYNETAEVIFNTVISELRNLGLIVDAKFQKLISPKYYNYSNDSINVEYHVNDENIEKIKSYIDENEDEFKSFLKENYTSYDGFISSYSNDPEDWSIDTIINDKHKFGSILNFILINIEGINENKLLSDIELPQIGIENYDTLIYEQKCIACGGFWEPETYSKTDNICPDCKENNHKIELNNNLLYCKECTCKIENRHEIRSLILNYNLNNNDIICSDCSLKNETIH